MTGYVDAIVSGRTPTLAQWREHLIAFHAAFPDTTTLALSLLRTETGDTSYAHVAARIAAEMPGAQSILDIGCGEGSLLLELAKRYAGDVRLHGVDLSNGDVTRARKDLPRAKVVCGDVLTESYESGAFDVAIGHLSFSLVPELDELLVRARRLLGRGGMLAIALEDPTQSDSIFQTLGLVLRDLVRAYPQFSAVVPHKAGIERDDCVTAWLADAGFARTRIERYCLSGLLSRGEFWEIARRVYPFGLLPKNCSARLRPRWKRTQRPIRRA